MKIGIDGTPLTTPFHCGTRHFEESLLLALATLDTKNQYYIFLPRKPHIPLPAKFKKIYMPAFPILKRQFFLPLAIKKVKLDIFQYFEPYGSFFLNHPKIITTVHDNDLSATYPWLSRFFLNRLHCEISRRLVLKRSKIILVSTSLAEAELHTMFPEHVKDKQIIVNHLSHSSIFKQLTAHRATSNYFLAMGDFARRKNLGMTLRAFDAYKEMGGTRKLKIVVSKKEFFTQFEKLLTSLQYKDEIEVIYEATNHSLVKLYSFATGFIYPSLYEGFGLPILEAMACGCPVITSDRGAMKEVAGSAGLLIDPLNQNQMVQAMLSLENPVDRKKWIRRGLERSKQFSWEKTAKTTIKAYEILAKIT